MTNCFSRRSASGATLQRPSDQGRSRATSMERAQLAGPRDLLDDAGLSRLGAVYVPRIGSLALRLALVSDGRLDCRFCGRRQATTGTLRRPILLVHEAGGRMTTLKGDTLRYNQRQLVARRAGRGRRRPAMRGSSLICGRIGPRIDRTADVRSSASIAIRRPRCRTTQQLLHLVLGGELTEIDGTEFKDLDKVEIVGLYPNYATAYAAWRRRRSRRSTTRICAISSSICTGCSIRRPTRPANGLMSARFAG